MKIKSYLIAALALSMTAGRLLAQNDGPDGTNAPAGPGGPGGPGGHRGGHHRPPSPLLEALDTNHDGVISADEIANAPAALKTLDKNGDGQLTADELRPMPPHDGNGTNNPPHMRGKGPDGDHKHPVPPLMKALDANGNGVISADEIANAPAALKTLDKNGDGQLTRDELMPPRPEGQDGNGPDAGQRPPPPDDK